VPLEMLTPAERAFRDEVGAFARAHVSPELRAKVAAGVELARDDYVTWQRTLAARGWLTPSWPVADGGTGWSAVEHYLFEDALAAAGAPSVGLTLGVGPKLFGPILCAHGTPEQKARFLPRIRDASDWWCQGYSEPNAGSDLARLETRAVRDGDHYVVTGTKIWTSYAHWANRACVLARTDASARPQAGISFFAIDLAHPGVTVRPIRTIDDRHFFNEIRFEAVRVPAANRVGAENAGWSIARSLLEHERLGAARVAETKQRIATARRIARERGRHDDPRWRRALDRIEIEALAIERTALRFVAAARAGRPIGAEISLLKLRGTELIQRLMDLCCDTLGERALGRERDLLRAPTRVPAHHATVAPVRLYYRGVTLAAGTSEVQRNVLARHLLTDTPAWT
jgi:alkylation response protein AidB-like acyl-CoA dehydrogenase